MDSIIRKNIGQDLKFMEIAVIEHRTERSVDKAADENFMFCWFAFAFDESAESFSCGREFFNIVDSQGEKVGLYRGDSAAACSRQQDRVSRAERHRAIS